MANHVFSLPLPERGAIEITAEFARALEFIESSNKHAFITGKAGTGKSTLLRHLRAGTKKRLAVVAPTGVAAVNVQGQTIHSFFRLPTHFIEREHVRKAGKNRRIIENLDTLVIDEVSMVRADLMDAVDQALRVNRDAPSVPFGGVQVVLFGDLFQLPPVVDEDLRASFDRRYASPYFFSAKAFEEEKVHRIELTRVFRQAGDPVFMNLLSRIRQAEWSEDDLETLNGAASGDALLAKTGRVVLTSTNAAARAINEARLGELPGRPRLYEAEVTGEFEESAFPTERGLSLKKGAQVMMVRNDPARRWVNGDLAVVSGVAEETIRVTIKGTEHEVGRVRWDKYRYGFDERTDKIVQETVGVFEQYPLKLAWAITIHKSQGQTFDDVVVDLGSGGFAHGQAYVALSRCTSLKGLRLRRPLRPRDFIFDRRILDYMGSTGDIH